MKKINKKQKLMVLISLFTIVVIIGLVIGINAIKANIINEKYNSSNGSLSNGNLLPEYIKEGITLGGVTGTLEVLDTSDATATPEDILYGKTAYVDGKKITGNKTKSIDILQVGDYVAYIPDKASDYVLSSSASGYTSNQTISQENFTWQVLSKNDDGTVNLISSNSSAKGIYLKGATGYNNGVFLLNDICAKLYSNSSLGITSRSINLDDLEKNMTTEGLNYVRSYVQFIAYGKSKTYTSNIYTYYPRLYAYENGAGINTTTVKKDGIEKSESYYSSPSTTNPPYIQASTSITVTQTFYDRTMSSNYYESSIFYDLVHSSTYWLATRFATNWSESATWGIDRVGSNSLSGANLYNSSNYDSTPGYSFRPIVSLNTNIKITDGDGKSSETAYQLMK